MTTQNLRDAVKAVLKREVYSNTILPQETRKTSNRQPNFTSKTTGKRRTTTTTNKHQNQQKERNNKYLSRNKRKRNERNSSKD